MDICLELYTTPVAFWSVCGIVCAMKTLADILRERGYANQFSCEKLEEITETPRTLYWGVDPTADSMHVGQLMGMLVLRHFLEHGHKIVLLAGGGTGMIGDPSGRSDERNLLDAATLNHNVAAIKTQMAQVFGSDDFEMVDNADWLSKINLMEFLRDVGKHFTINQMIKKDIVRDRLEKESPISFTEFSYSLLQGYDFLHLYEHKGCDMQVGGSDQWSNILAGVEFIRRKKERTVYAYTWPLLINKSTGRKFGKSEGGAVWLDAKKTDPFTFYQFWVNSDDADVEEYLLKMTLLSLDEIAEVVGEHKADTSKRVAQKRLAYEVTTIVHGKDVAAAQENVSQVLFGSKELADLSDKEIKLLANTVTQKVSIGGTVVEALDDSNLASSKREARHFISNGAIKLNGVKIEDEDREFTKDDFTHGIALLQRGKQKKLVLQLV